MKLKIPSVSKRNLRKLKSGKSAQLIKVPKGKRIFWYADGVHYKFINQ